MPLAQPAQAVIDFDGLPHVQDIAVDPASPGSLLLATRAGLFVASAEGSVAPLALRGQNLAALVAAPDASGILFASGSDAKNAPIGLLKSRDGGRTWETVSPGASGPAAYRALGLALDRRTLYGSYGGVQRSPDGGASWKIVSRGPWDVYDMAVSASSPDRVYVASRGGLFASDDAGRRWRSVYDAPSATLALATRDGGELYAFVVGRGLLRATEPELDWKTVHEQFGEQVLTKLVFDARDSRHMYALNQFGRVIESGDGGASWGPFGGARGPTTAAGRRGEALYGRLCQQCHGASGVGENTTDEILANPNYLRAPMLDDSTHAWHHSDADIVKTIMNGSTRDKRMPAFKEQVSESQARELLGYVKSLWGARALRCQGEKHMSKECRR
jgi:photosystem II stability/assembly factor-like uncharacterized protein